MWGDEDFHVGRCWRTEPANGGGFSLMTALFVRWPSGNVSTDCVSGLSVARACQDPPNNRQRPIAPTVNRGTGFTIMSIHTHCPCPGLEHGKHQRQGRRIRAARLGFSHDGWRPASLSLEKSWLNPLNKSQECHHSGESWSTAFNCSLLHPFLFCFCRPWLASLPVLCTDIIMEHASVVSAARMWMRVGAMRSRRQTLRLFACRAKNGNLQVEFSQRQHPTSRRRLALSCFFVPISSYPCGRSSSFRVQTDPEFVVPVEQSSFEYSMTVTVGHLVR